MSSKGADFLNKHIITEDVLKKYSAEAEIRKVRPAGDFIAELKDVMLNGIKITGDRLPWQKTTDAHMREGEITIWTGYSGHNKSMILGEVALGLIAQGKAVCIASAEMKPVVTLKRMLRQFAGTSYASKVTIEDFQEFIEDKLWIYDQSGMYMPKTIDSIARCVADKFSINHFILDSFMKVSIKEDDLSGQKQFINMLTATAKDYNIHVHLVAHQRKPENGDETKPGTKSSVMGSSNITNLADNVVVVFKYHEDAPNEHGASHLVSWVKQRNYEGESNPEPKYMFYFDSASFQFKENDFSAAKAPMEWIQPKFIGSETTFLNAHVDAENSKEQGIDKNINKILSDEEDF